MPVTGHYDTHPAYRPQAYLVAKKAKLGLNRPNVPNWEVEVERGIPWFGGASLDSNEDGVNAAGIAYDWFTDDIAWLGLPDARLDQASFESVRANSDDFRISPLITDQTEFKARLASLAEYADVWVRVNDGLLIELGQWAHGDLDLEDLPIVTDDDLEEEPDLEPSTYDDCVTKVTVTYCDRLHYYNEQNSEPASNPHLLKVIGEPREVTLLRPWITNGEQANRYAAEYAATYSKPRISGSISIKRERAKAKGLHVPGKLFKLQSATLELEIVMRSMEVDWPGARDAWAKLTIENERSIWPNLYHPPAAPTPGNFIVEAIAIAHARIWELPSGLKTSAAKQIYPLAQRPSPSIVGFNLFGSADGGDVYDPLATQIEFAAYGRVKVAYAAPSSDLDTTVGLQVEIFGVDTIETQTDTQRDDNTILLIAGNKIISVGQVTALGSGVLKIYGRHGVFDSAIGAHFVNDEVYFIRREKITPIGNSLFARGATRLFKLQPFTAQASYDLALITPLSYTFSLGSAVNGIFDLSLTSAARAGASGNVVSHLYATWDWARSQDIFLFEIAFKETAAGDAAWRSETVVIPDDGTLPRADLIVTPQTGYDVKVRPINSHGEPGEWTEPPLSIVSATISRFRVDGLELVGQGNDTDCTGRDFHFQVRLNSPERAPDLGGIMQPGASDPLLDYFLWEVYAGAASYTQVTQGQALKVYEEKTGTSPLFTFSYGKNLDAAALHELIRPYAQITVAVYAVDTQQQISQPDVNTFQNPDPDPPSALTAQAAFRNAFFEFIKAANSDLEATEILESLTGNVADAVVVGDVPAPGDTFVRQIEPGQQRWYWARSRDDFGNHSAVHPSGAGVTITGGQIAVTDIDNFPDEVTSQFGAIVVLRDEVWSNNTPIAGSIAWNAHQIWYKGQAYEILAGNTAFEVVWWHVGDGYYSAANSKPDPDSSIFVVAANRLNSGVVSTVWNDIANAVIGTASILRATITNALIANLAVDNAKIANVDAAKITTGFLAAGRIAAGSITIARLAAEVTAVALGGDAAGAASAAQAAAIAAAAADATSKANTAALYAIAAALTKADYLSPGTTTINGGLITTNTIAAACLLAGSTFTHDLYVGAVLEMAAGGIIRGNFVDNTSGFRIGSDGKIKCMELEVVNGLFSSNLSAPTISPNGQNYTGSGVTVTLSGQPTGWTLRFTTDGTDVLPTSAAYTGPFSIGGGGVTSTVVRARAFDPGGPRATPQSSATFTKVPVTAPTEQLGAPYIAKTSGTRGSSGYQVHGGSRDPRAEVTWASVNGGAYYPYDGSPIAPGVNGSVFLYDTADGYLQSPIEPFYNVAASGGITPPPNQPPGTDVP